MSLMYSTMNTTGTALISTESALTMPEVNLSQLLMDTAPHQDLCRKRMGTTYSCHQYQQGSFFVRASDMVGFLTAEGVYIIIIILPSRLIHVAVGCTIGSRGMFFFFDHQMAS